MKETIKLIAFSIICSLMTVHLYAQETNSAQNRIVNEFKQPIQGAVIKTEDNKFTSRTTKDGVYKLPLNLKEQFVVISASGYQNVRMPISQLIDQSEITLFFDPHDMGGEVNLGHKYYNKESITGAVSVVSGEVLDKTPSNVLSDTYEGRLPGLTVINNIAELTFYGYGNHSRLIRGHSSINGNNPQMIIDGVIAPTQYIEFISPKEIESISVLKDASSAAAFGIQGASGIIIVTTKRGYEGKLHVEAYADQSFQQMTRRPQFINSVSYARLRNEAGERDGLGSYSQFSPDEINLFETGNDNRYPNNNWFDQYIKEVVMRQRAGVNVTGGTNKFRYYSNLSFTHQGEPLIITDEKDRKYDPTPKTYVGNFRSNMDIQFNDHISGYMRLTGNVKRELLAGGYMGWSIYNNIFYQPPTMYGPLSPVNEDKPELSEQVVTVDDLDNPVYGMLNRAGYRTVIETNVIAQAGVKVDLTEGLSMSGGLAYQTYVRNETGTNQSYVRVMRKDDYSTLDNFTRYKTFQNTPLSYNKGSVFFYYLNIKGSIDYNRRFGDHCIDASLHTFYLKHETESGGSSSNVLPYKRQNFGFSALYGYKDRYFLRTDAAYSGSEQFHPDKRYMLTPAISAAWIASKEDFFQSNFISLLKFRSSYGINANDQISGLRFLYLDNIRYDGSEAQIGNPKLEAERIRKLNLGANLGLLNMFTVDFDYFMNNVNNMLINSSAKIPSYQGVPLQYFPRLNEGEMENKGFEVSFGFNKHLSKDLSLFAKANFMQTKNKVININESPLGDEYAFIYRTQGYPIGQIWGYEIDKRNGNGIFNTVEELNNSSLTYSFGVPRVGDFIYKDLNNDGVIDQEDLAPMGNPTVPQQEYSIVGGFKWKKWDFSFLFHGVRKWSQMLSGGLGINESLGRGIYSDIHLKAWTPERYASGETISFPALSLSPSTNHQSNDFFLADRSYFRLRNIELAYTLPEQLSKKIHSEKIRMAFTIQNLLTFDNMKTKNIDPEIGAMNTFQPYRVFNIGINANF